MADTNWKMLVSRPPRALQIALNSYATINSPDTMGTLSLLMNAPEAYDIDQKIDDGLPNKGKVAIPWVPDMGGACYVDASGNALGVGAFTVTGNSDLYWALAADSDLPNCGLMFYADSLDR